MLQTSQENFEKENKDISNLDINVDHKSIIIKPNSNMLSPQKSSEHCELTYSHISSDHE